MPSSLNLFDDCSKDLIGKWEEHHAWQLEHAMQGWGQNGRDHEQPTLTTIHQMPESFCNTHAHLNISSTSINQNTKNQTGFYIIQIFF
jgi:hypothetical protein